MALYGEQAEESRVRAESSRAAGGAIRDIGVLAERGLIPVRQVALLEQVAQTYTVAVPAAFAALIDPDDPADPIARQVIPDVQELTILDEELTDPIGDAAFSPVPGIVHRYPDRVLLRPVLSCPLYCRFCFRREVVGRASGSLSPGELDRAIEYVVRTPGIREVILTGGDPLLLSARRLGRLLARLAAIEQVETLRIHSRVPIAAPERVDADLLDSLAIDKPVWLSVHTNHPRELTDTVADGLDRLARRGIPLLSQTVLLRGINDDPAILEMLFRRLVGLRVKPYYLHHPDLAPGTGHFRLGLAEGQALYRQLRGRISGHALPTYVLDIPGGAGKVPVEAPWVLAAPGGGFVVTDPNGHRHHYD